MAFLKNKLFFIMLIFVQFLHNIADNRWQQVTHVFNVMQVKYGQAKAQNTVLQWLYRFFCGIQDKVFQKEWPHNKRWSKTTHNSDMRRMQLLTRVLWHPDATVLPILVTMKWQVSLIRTHDVQQPLCATFHLCQYPCSKVLSCTFIHR